MSSLVKKTVYLYHHTHNGRAQIVPCLMSLMSLADLDSADRLHRRVELGLGPETFIPTSREELEWLIGGKGLSVGVWHENRLVCMRAVQTDPEWVNDSLMKIGLGPDPEGRTAVTDHCIVDKEYRGNNVQFLTNYEIENLVAGNFDTLATTVAPRNIFSLQNILSCNFHIVKLNLRYGGYLRYTLVKNFRSGSSIWSNGHYMIPIRDIRRQQQMMNEGYVGYKLKRMSAGFTVFYAPIGTLPQARHLRMPARNERLLLT